MKKQKCLGVLHEFLLWYIVLMLFCNRTINAAGLVAFISLCLIDIRNIHFNNSILSAKGFYFWENFDTIFNSNHW